MARTRTYHHFCPVARSLEVIGEKWSLLIVRDLLRGPQRFTDLLRYMGGITPKWLTLRLRDLEASGIVEADRQPGRREVWYSLTPKGHELAPVVDALSVWGLEHALRPPLPEEPVHPAQTTAALLIFFGKKGIGLPHPATWVVRLGAGRVYTVRFDGTDWTIERREQEAADVVVETTPAVWAGFLLGTPTERRQYLRDIRFDGPPERVDEIVKTFGWKLHSARTQRVNRGVTANHGDARADPSPRRVRQQAAVPAAASAAR